jgi:hypothetical protein
VQENHALVRTLMVIACLIEFNRILRIRRPNSSRMMLFLRGGKRIGRTG